MICGLCYSTCECEKEIGDQMYSPSNEMVTKGKGKQNWI